MTSIDTKIVKLVPEVKEKRRGRPKMYTEEERIQRQKETRKAYYEANKEKSLQQSKEYDHRISMLRAAVQELLDDDYPLPESFLEKLKECKITKKNKRNQ